MAFRIAVVGATGAVGQELLEVLHRRRFPCKEVRLLASERSCGRTLPFGDRTLEVAAVSEDSFVGIDVALFSAGSNISKRFARAAIAAGALVIDNSSAFRMDPDVPLVVPEVNPEAARGMTRGIIANPNCTTIITLLALAPLHRAAKITRFTAASYQAASGAGAKAMAELEDQVRAHVQGDPLPVAVFPHPLAFNCLPHVDVFLEDGYTREEQKMIQETRKILSDDQILCSATCVRVPVLRAHAIAVHLETKTPLEPAQARALLEAAPGIRVVDDPEQCRYPLQIHAAGEDDVMVGRIRKDRSHPNGLVLWVVGDQLLKGAALNAVQCAELALGLPPYTDGAASASDGSATPTSGGAAT